jgi:IS5 family transposase
VSIKFLGATPSSKYSIQKKPPGSHFLTANTVQEKNITFPTDTNLLTKIVTRCRIMAKLEDVKLWHSYQREIKKLLRTIRFKSKGRKQGEAQRAIRRLRTIAGVLIREMRRKLSPEALEIHRQSLYSQFGVQENPIPEDFLGSTI